MRFFLLFTGLVAAEAMFDDPMIHPQMKREMLQPRQSIPDLSPSCTSALLGIYSSIPTPPARLVTAIGGDNNNPCSATVPSSLSSEYSSYESRIGSWYSQSSSDVSSALSECPELSRLATLLPVCVTSFLGGAAGGGSASGSGTNTASSGASSTATSSGSGSSGTATSTTSGGSASSQTSGSSSSSSSSGTGSSTTGTQASATSATGTSTGAAPKETGFAIAALAAAGAIAAAL